MTIISTFNHGQSTMTIAQDLGVDQQAVNHMVRSLYALDRLARNNETSQWTSAAQEIQNRYQQEMGAGYRPVVSGEVHPVTRHDIEHWRNYREVQVHRYGVRQSREQGIGNILRSTLQTPTVNTPYIRPHATQRSPSVATTPTRPPPTPSAPPAPPTPPAPPPPSSNAIQEAERRLTEAIRRADAEAALRHTAPTPNTRPAPEPSYRRVPRTRAARRPLFPQPPTPAPTPRPEPTAPPEEDETTASISLLSSRLSGDPEYRNQIYDTLKSQLWTAFEIEREYNGTRYRNERELHAHLSELLETTTVDYRSSHSLPESFFSEPSNPYNVAFITHDGSVQGTSGFGAEINIVGTNESMVGLLPRYRTLFEMLDQADMVPGKTTATHCHVRMLQQTYLPQEIAFGTVELVRVMMPLLLVASGTGGWDEDGERGILRSGAKRYGDPLWVIDHMDTSGFSSYRRWVEHLNAEAEASIGHVGSSPPIHYIGLNVLQNTPYTTDGKHTRGLHIEYRFGDGTDFPAQVAALSELYKAIILRAAEYYRDTGQAYRSNARLITLSRQLTAALLRDRSSYTPEVAAQMRMMLDEMAGQMTPMAFNVLKTMMDRPAFKVEVHNARRASAYEQQLEDVTRDTAEARRSFIRHYTDQKTIDQPSPEAYIAMLRQRMQEAGTPEGDLPTTDELKNLGFLWDDHTHQMVYAPRMGMICPSCRVHSEVRGPVSPGPGGDTHASLT